MKTLKVSSSWGHYNLCNPSEKSCSIHIEFLDEEEKKYINISFREPPFEPDGYVDAEEIAELIDKWEKTIWISTSRKENLSFKELILKNTGDISAGNKEMKIKDLIRKKEKIEQQIKNLTNPV